MATASIFAWREPEFCFGFPTHRSRSHGCDDAGSPHEVAGILLGSDLHHRHRPIHYPSADPRMAALRGHRAGSRAGRGFGYILRSQRAGLWSGNHRVRSFGVDLASRRRIPLRRDYPQYRFPDSPVAYSVDRRMAQISGGFTGNCRTAGRNHGMAAKADLRSNRKFRCCVHANYASPR